MCQAKIKKQLKSLTCWSEKSDKTTSQKKKPRAKRARVAYLTFMVNSTRRRVILGYSMRQGILAKRQRE